MFHVLHFQANNAYIFPGFGLGLVISGATRVHDDMLLAACKELWHSYLLHFFNCFDNGNILCSLVYDRCSIKI